MDSFEINKIAGAVLATCLGLLSLNIVANAIFSPRMPEQPGYEIAVAEPEKPGEPAAAAKEEPLPERIAKADADRGKAAFKRCVACHTVEKSGPNRVGPNLYGVVGRTLAGGTGFNYSGGMQKKGGDWTPEHLDEFLRNPKQTVPGTSMIFAGVPRASERADLVVYLNAQSDKPVELPKADPAAAPADKKEAAPDKAGEKPAEEKAADPKAGEPKAEDKKAADEKAAGDKPEADKPEADKPEADKKAEKPAEGEKPASEAPAEPAK